MVARDAAVMEKSALDDEQLLERLHILVELEKKVVSYKWLSRAFYISSNSSKNVLLRFADQEKDCVQVVYLVSGWTKSEPKTFLVQLTVKSKLEGVKASLSSVSSVHIYSVQPSVPKDPADLWTADHLQSQELFNQPVETENCLRDNRFSGVTCTIVKRNTAGPSRKVIPQPPAVPPAGLQDGMRTGGTTHDKSRESDPPAKAVPSGLVADRGMSDKQQKGENGQPVPGSGSGKRPPTHTAATGAAGASGKSKGSAGGGAGGGPAALASFWSRAATKPKLNSAPCTLANAHMPEIGNRDPTASVPVDLAGDAEAKIRAMEGEIGEESSDDENPAAFVHGKRSASRSGGACRRRWMVADDDTEEDTVVVDVDMGQIGNRVVEGPSNPPEDRQTKGCPVGNGHRKAGEEEEEEGEHGREQDEIVCLSGSEGKEREHLRESAGEERPGHMARDGDNGQVGVDIHKNSWASDGGVGVTCGQGKKGGSRLNEDAMRKGQSSSKKESPPLHSKRSLNCNGGGGSGSHSIASGGVDENNAGSKKRKVVRTRIDERGREVADVVWVNEDGEEVPMEDQRNMPAAAMVSNSEPARIQKPAAVERAAAAAGQSGRGGAAASTTAGKPAVAHNKPTAKASGGAGKGGSSKKNVPGVKQPGIMSFFTKKS